MGDRAEESVPECGKGQEGLCGLDTASSQGQPKRRQAPGQRKA